MTDKSIYGTDEVAPGKWRISIEFPGPVALINLDGGELPEGSFKPWPNFDSKEQAEAFIKNELETEDKQ